MHDACCPQDSTVKVAWEKSLSQKKREAGDFVREPSLLSCLSNPQRILLAHHLIERDHCVCELVALASMKPSLVSYHLGKMRAGGAVEAYASAKWKYYRLMDSARRVLSALEPG